MCSQFRILLFFFWRGSKKESIEQLIKMRWKKKTFFREFFGTYFCLTHWRNWCVSFGLIQFEKYTRDCEKGREVRALLNALFDTQMVGIPFSLHPSIHLHHFILHHSLLFTFMFSHSQVIVAQFQEAINKYWGSKHFTLLMVNIKKIVRRVAFYRRIYSKYLPVWFFNE